MQICAEHWQQLRDAIAAEGVARFVAESGEQAIRALTHQIEGTSGPDDFDPLMAAHNMIVSAALEKGGLAVMQGCPFEALQEMHKATCGVEGCTFTYAATWIPGAAHDAAETARQLLDGGEGEAG